MTPVCLVFMGLIMHGMAQWVLPTAWKPETRMEVYKTTTEDSDLSDEDGSDSSIEDGSDSSNEVETGVIFHSR